MATFHKQTLVLAHGQQANYCLHIHIHDEVSGIFEHAKEAQETPSLDKLFKVFKAKRADPTGRTSQFRKGLQLQSMNADACLFMLMHAYAY